MAVISTSKVLVPTVVGAVLGWLLGIFTEPVRRSFLGPRLRMIFTPEEPYLTERTQRIEPCPDYVPITVYHLRIGVRNLGKSAASRLRVLLASIEMFETARKNWVAVDWFVPIGLNWCHGVQQELASLNPGASFFFDLGVIRPNVQNRFESISMQMGEISRNQLVLKTSVIGPETANYILSEGRYLLRIQVSGENSQPVDATFEVNLASGWTDNINDLVQSGTSISLVGQTNQSILATDLESISK